MVKKSNYLTNIDNDLYYGTKCKNCINRHAKQFAVSDKGKFTTVTYRCDLCGKLLDITYLTSHYREACDRLGLTP